MTNEYLDLLKSAPTAAGAAPEPNEYLELLQGEADRKRQALAGNLTQAVGVDPDKYSAQRRVAGYLGYPVAAVQALPDLTQQAKVRQVQADAAAHPELEKRYTDADFARLAHDDSSSLGLFATLANSFRRGVPGLKQNFSATALRANSNALADLDRVEATLAAGGRVLDSQDPAGVQYMTPEQRAQYRASLGQAAGGNAASIAAAQAEKAQYPSPAVTAQVMQSKTFSEAVSAFLTDPVKFIASIGPESLVQNAPGLVAGAVVPGGAAAKATTMGAGSFVTDFGSSLLDALGKAGVNLTDPEALAAAAKDTRLMQRVAAQAMAHATIVSSVDAASGGLAARLVLPAKVLTKAPVGRELANIAAQTPIQGAFGGLGEAGGQIAAGQELDPGNILAEIVGEAFTAPAEVATIAGATVRERMAQAKQAKADAAQAQQLLDASRASKLRQRDPVTFAEFANAAADDAEVFIDAKTFAQSVPPEKLAALPQEITEQLADAQTAGGDIAIKVGDLAAHLADVPELAQHIRKTPEAMSAAEAAAFNPDDELRAEVDRLFPPEPALEPRAEAVAQARQSVADALAKVGRFTPQANAQYVELLSAFIATSAERNNLTPAEIQGLVPRIVSQLDNPGSAFEQSATSTPAFQKWFGESKVVDSAGKPLVVYHGSPDARFVNDGGVFATMKDRMLRWGNTPESRRDADESRAFFFTTSRAVAKTYANDARAFDYQNAEAGVIPAFVSLKNPLEFDAGGAHWREAQRQISKDDFIKEAKKAGHDGVIIRNVRDSYDSLETGRDPVSDVVVAFKSNQIKHAERNRGTYDPNDPSILNQDARGIYAPDSKTIALLKDADLSTFLHESGHFFLDTIATQAQRADAPAEVKADMQTVLDWFGVKDLATWQAMTIDQQREHHEKFARGFEAYLMEGKAPTTELAKVFARFRGWLVALYRRLTALDVELTPEVRAVMDRMLATDEQIAATAARRGGAPLFTTAEAAGMTAEEFATYQAQGQQAIEDAVASLQGASIRDLQFIANSKARALRKLDKEAQAKRAAIEEQVAAEVNALPIYQAWRDLARGKTEDGQAVRLSLPEIKETHPELVVRLPHGVATNDPNAQPADLVAEAYGLTSGDELVKLLATLDKPADVIEARTDQLMLERHGELYDPAALERAAHAAIANDARARVLSTEANALARAVGGVQIANRAAREFADAAVARRKVRELRPGQFTAAEARAGRQAAAAFKKGDLATAASAKREQTLQHMLARTTAATLAEVERAVDYLGKFDSAATRKAIGPEYADQIDQLLERVDLRTGQSLRAIDKRKSLAAWVASQEEQGLAPAVDERLLNEAARTSFKDMTVEELRGLVDTVKNIEHLGRLKERLLTQRDQRTFAETVETIAGSIAANGGAKRPVALEGERGVKPWLEGMAAAHRKISSLVHQMDGGKDAGPLWSALVRPMNDAGTREQVMIEKATLRLAEIYKPIMALKGGTNGAKVFIPAIGASLTRAGRLSVALNWGNEGNRQRLLDGDRWTADQVQAIVRTLSPVELQFVNDVHEYIDSFWPEIQAQQLRVSGVSEEKVEASPWVATASDGTQVPMRGGYYPAKYDTARSAKAESHDAAQVAKDMLSGAYVRATTRRGFTKARAEMVKDRPLRKDLGVITQHVTEVVHNLAWQEWLSDANRLLGNKLVDGAIREHYGPTVIRTLKDDLQGIATADVVSGTAIDQALLQLRANVSRATMGLSFTTALMQPFGLTQSMARIGARPVLRGMARWGGDAARMESSMTWISEKSDFMRLRAKTFNRELREISGRVQGQSKAAQVIDAGLFYLTTKAQQIADVPTWIGRYEQALAEGMDEATAVAQADQAVISSQGGGQTKDLAEIQRKHPMLTQFYSYFSVTLNLTAEKTAATDFRNPKAVAGWLADMALLLVIPAIVPAALTELLRGGGSDDPEKWAEKVLEWQAGYLLGLVVGVREFSGLVGGYPYAGPPVARIVTDVAKTAQQVKQGEIDEPAVAATVRLLGDAFGIPSAQAVRSYRGWQAWSEGDAPATAVLMGPPPKE